LQPAARLPDVDVGTRRDSGPRGAEGQERDALAAQVVYERPSLHAVGMHGDVERLAMVEAEPIVSARLPERADRQRVAKPTGEEPLEHGQPGQRPPGTAGKAYQRDALLRLAGGRGRQRG